MRILWVAQSFWPQLGGAEVMAYRLARTWAEQGHQVTVLTCRLPATLPNAESHAGFRIVRLPWLPLRWLGTLHHVRTVESWIVRYADQFDVIGASLLKHSAFAAVGAGRRLGKPVILRAEGAGATGDVAYQRGARMGAWLTRRCQAADAVIAPSRTIERELRAANYPCERLHYLPNAVPVPAESWSPQSTRVYRQRLGLPTEPSLYFWVYTGRLHRDKGLATLIDALGRLSEEHRLLLVGSGPEEGALRARATAVGVSARLHWVGTVESVEPYLRAADAFVLPSHFEGLSLSLLEAVVLGLPVLASEIDANRGLFAGHGLELSAEPLTLLPVDDVNAWVNAMDRFFRHRTAVQADATQMRQAAQTRYGLPTIAAQYVDLFNRLLLKRL